MCSCEPRADAGGGGEDAGGACVPSAADDTTCDGIDDDCDGFVDEEYAPAATSCGVGACAAAGGTTCDGGQVADHCTPGAPLGIDDATCDGVDDDCDEVADEDYAPEDTTCGVGACAAAGRTACVAGVIEDGCVPGEPAAADDATCDGVDDDCSGEVDEEFVPDAVLCGVGACAATGSAACVGGQVETSCTPGQAAADDATCDGVDDDCSGEADEDYVSRDTACGVGACAAVGVTTCVEGGEVDGCTPGAAAADDSVCNGVDDDCADGVDEDYVDAPTSCGVGACEAAGTARCIGGQVIDDCEAGQAAADDATCDGIDDDCDGQADDDFAQTMTECGVGACHATGLSSCVGGQPGDSCQAGQPAVAETCNGQDDTCEGDVDEGFAVGDACAPLGACQAAERECNVAGDGTDCVQIGTSAERCNDVDDDCDGAVDEDFGLGVACPPLGECLAAQVACNDAEDGTVCSQVGALAERCNGLDDDCDGAADEDYPVDEACDPVGACITASLVCNATEDGTDCVQQGASAETCNGADDDCDGAVDDLPPLDCQLGDCALSVPACREGEDNACPGPGDDVYACDQGDVVRCEGGGWVLDQRCEGLTPVCVGNGAGGAVCGTQDTLCEGCESYVGRYCEAENSCPMDFSETVVTPGDGWCTFHYHMDDDPDPGVDGPYDADQVGCETRSDRRVMQMVTIETVYDRDDQAMYLRASGLLSCEMMATQGACQ